MTAWKRYLSALNADRYCVCNRRPTSASEGRRIDGSWAEDRTIYRRFQGKWVCCFSCYRRLPRIERVQLKTRNEETT